MSAQIISFRAYRRLALGIQAPEWRQPVRIEPTIGNPKAFVNWYCVYTRPQREESVSAHLAADLGLEAYLPLLRRQKTIRRVRRVVTSPLFPRYLFCRFDFACHHRAVRYAADVTGLVSFGEQPAIVRDSMIDDLKRWAGDVVDFTTMQPSLSCGDLVEISEGPMRGLQAVILHRLNDRDRVAVLLSLLERDVQMNISRDQLRRVV